jgi:hypothetical protein
MDTKCEATGDAPVSDHARRGAAFELVFQTLESLGWDHEHETFDSRHRRGLGCDLRD